MVGEGREGMEGDGKGGVGMGGRGREGWGRWKGRGREGVLWSPKILKIHPDEHWGVNSSIPLPFPSPLFHLPPLRSRLPLI